MKLAGDGTSAPIALVVNGLRPSGLPVLLPRIRSALEPDGLAFTREAATPLGARELAVEARRVASRPAPGLLLRSAPMVSLAVEPSTTLPRRATSLSFMDREIRVHMWAWIRMRGGKGQAGGGGGVWEGLSFAKERGREGFQ